MSRERRKKLTGRDYTASVVIEVLELEGIISHDLYRELEIARKCRNKWMHEMASPKASEVKVCVSAAFHLVRRVWGIDLPTFHPQGGRGVPATFTWAWEEIKGRPAPPVEL